MGFRRLWVGLVLVLWVGCRDTARPNPVPVVPDGGISVPNDGGTPLPGGGDSGILLPNDGGILLPDDGGILLPDDGGIVLPDDGGILLPDDGGIILPDGDGGVILPDDGGVILPDDAGTGTPDDGGVVLPPDAGVDAGTGVGAGPWPTAPVTNFSAQYGVGAPLAFGVDEAQNIWLLNSNVVGVLRPGETAPRWVQGIGQAAQPFGSDALARDSTVMCGGTANRVYVGYAADDLGGIPGRPDVPAAFIFSPDGLQFPGYNTGNPSNYDPARYAQYMKGDADVVTLDANGNPTLEEHLQRSVGNGPKNIGLHNTNDYHFDEDRSVLSCTRVTRGALKGDVYIGTNHGVTRIQGLNYNSHRHPTWDVNGSLRIGYSYGIGIAPNGDVLIANDWKFSVTQPSAPLANWDRIDESLNPTKVNAYLPELNSLADKDYWRGFQETPSGAYYLASATAGLWRMDILDPTHAKGTKVAGLPTDSMTSLAATDDGSVFLGTSSFGLWRLTPAGSVEAVASVPGGIVRGLFYEPGVQPAMLFVLTEQGLFGLRGY